MQKNNKKTLINVLKDRSQNSRKRHTARHYLRQNYSSEITSIFLEIILQKEDDPYLRFCLIRELPRLEGKLKEEQINNLSKIAISLSEPEFIRKEVYRVLNNLNTGSPELERNLESKISAEIKEKVEKEKFTPAIIEYMINVLNLARDTYGDEETPLFTDGLKVDSLNPLKWVFKDKEWIISNFAVQQNLMKTLAGLTKLTGNKIYRKEAEETVSFLFDNYQYGGGLLPWGGHHFIDLEFGERTSEPEDGGKPQVHELKADFPFYELLFAVDCKSACRMVKGMWAGHIKDWSNKFYHSRHGQYLEELPEDVWDRPFSDPEPHQKIPRVGAMNHTSNDLMFAAAYSYRFAEDEGALKWAKRKGRMWIKARNSDTNLGSYYYHLEPTHYPSTDDYRGFEWPEFEEYGEAATSTRLWAKMGWPNVIYGMSAMAKFRIAELLGEEGEEFYNWAYSALRAFADSQAYNPENNTINRLLTDGRIVESEAAEAGSSYFYSFSLGYRFTGDSVLWPVIRGIAKGHTLGELGVSPGEKMNLNMKTEITDSDLIFGLLELYKALDEEKYFKLAQKIGHNILEKRYKNGFFIKNKNAYFADAAPLALLSLEAVLQDSLDLMPFYSGSKGGMSGNGHYE